MIPIGRATSPRIRSSLQTILDDPSFRESARRIAAANRDAGGVGRAADIIEGLEMEGATGC